MNPTTCGAEKLLMSSKKVRGLVEEYNKFIRIRQTNFYSRSTNLARLNPYCHMNYLDYL